MIRVIVVDDEPLAVDRLVRLCGQLEQVEIAGTAKDAAAALVLAETGRVDVVLLDIRMPGKDGLSLASQLSSLGKTAPAIVFVTAHADFAVHAFELAAIDYILKPVSPSRLQEALKRAAFRSNTPFSPADQDRDAEVVWWVPHGGEVIRLAPESVELITAERDYVRLHACGKSYLLRDTMATIEQALDPASFLRVHRSAIVRCSAVEALRLEGGRWTLRMARGLTVPVGRSHLPRVRAELTKADGPLALRRRTRSR